MIYTYNEFLNERFLDNLNPIKNIWNNLINKVKSFTNQLKGSINLSYDFSFNGFAQFVKDYNFGKINIDEFISDNKDIIDNLNQELNQELNEGLIKNILMLAIVFCLVQSCENHREIRRKEIDKEFYNKMQDINKQEQLDIDIIKNYTTEILTKKGWDKSKIILCNAGESYKYSLSTQVNYEKTLQLVGEFYYKLKNYKGSDKNQFFELEYTKLLKNVDNFLNHY